MRTLAGWLAIVTLVLGTLTLCIRFLEPRLAFFPRPGEQQTPKDFGVLFTTHTIPTADGQRLHAWHLPHKNPHARVVYFHGNAGNLSVWADVFVGVWRQNFEVIAVDYRGYGLSTGQPSESGLYQDVEATIAFVHDRLPPIEAPLVYWGRSLGTPMAAYAATRRPPDGIVLESGFPDLRAVVESNRAMWFLSWFMSYSFSTATWMASVQQPTLVLHGDQDRVVPHAIGQRLYEGLPGPKQFVTLPGLDHNDDIPEAWPMYWDVVKRFAASLRQQGH